MENVSTVQIKPETSWVFLMHRNNFLSPSLSTSYNMEGMISRCYQSGCVHLSYCLPTSSFLSIFWPFCFPLLTIYCGCRWISFPNSSIQTRHHALHLTRKGSPPFPTALTVQISPRPMVSPGKHTASLRSHHPKKSITRSRTLAGMLNGVWRAVGFELLFLS